MTQVDAVFAGGGIKAMAFVGALGTLEQKGIHINRVAGTSAGALTAAFIKANYTNDEMYQLFTQLDMNQFLDQNPISTVFPFLRWIQLYKRMGLYKGKVFEDWVASALYEKGIRTFGDLPSGTLKLVASDLTNGRFIVLPDDLPRYGIDPVTFSIAKAVRMSCSLPFFFEPVKLKGEDGKESLIVDGGVLSNFPLWLFVRKGKKAERPVLGMKLSPEFDQSPPKEIPNGLSMLTSMFDTMRTAHDQRYVSKFHAKDIIFIPVNEITATQFKMSDEEKDRLIQLGAESTRKFLAKWSY
ncbi:patatin-like phospholipase family protein [Salipaludibacillus sp. CF4.18]|uniref:patatin-like phospholipase family protein n=1 Tax=Salipaludibacillus sp. CF4.18 TaxID=3373081 RepID=UPI003EE7C643